MSIFEERPKISAFYLQKYGIGGIFPKYSFRDFPEVKICDELASAGKLPSVRSSDFAT